MSDKPIIEVKDLVAAYGELVILNGVSFTVRPGEIFVVLGGSGCGKSTLLKHMIGLYKPAGGTIRIGDDDISAADDAEKDKILKRFGVLYQSGALLSALTVKQNIALPLKEFTTLNKEQIDLLIKLKLQLVALDGYEDFYPSQLSGGMRKRAALARAMALDPEILFFDEPSAGLDPVTSADLDALIRQINTAFGTTMVVVTHELASIFNIADRVIMLDRTAKNIIARGNPLDLKDNHPNPIVQDFFKRRSSLRR